MKYYLIHTAAAAGLTVPHSIEPTFGHFYESMGSYLGNDISNVGFQMLNCLKFVAITLFFNGAPLEIVERCQIALTSPFQAIKRLSNV